MKAAKAGKIWHPQELSIAQRNAIDLLIVGKTDQETADLVGVTRQTVQVWRTEHLLFQSELEQARGLLWRVTAERLRGLMAKALDNIAKALDEGDVKASFELLKATGLYGSPEINSVSDWRIDKRITQVAEAQAEREGFVKDTMRALIDVSDNPTYRRRVEEIEDELRVMYCEPEP
jgi:hypothetical protein